MFPLAMLDSRHFMWAGEYLSRMMGDEFWCWVGRKWRGPFESICAMELAASAID